jgi:hypothetical protein
MSGCPALKGAAKTEDAHPGVKKIARPSGPAPMGKVSRIKGPPKSKTAKNGNSRFPLAPSAKNTP